MSKKQAETPKAAKRQTTEQKAFTMLAFPVPAKKPFVYNLKGEGCKVELQNGTLTLKLTEESDVYEVTKESPFDYVMALLARPEVQKAINKFYPVYEMLT